MTYHPRLASTDTPSGHSKGDILAYNNGGVYVNAEHFLAGSDRISIRLLHPEAEEQPDIVPYLVILHTQAGSRKATNEQAWAYANRVDVKNDAHFYGPDMITGAILQALPLTTRADSNGPANRFLQQGVYRGAISFETQDAGSPTLNKTPWTWAQIGTMCAAITAICFTYRIRCTPCGWPLDSGISQHNAFPEWSASAHSCPGTARTRQMDGIRQEVANRLLKVYTDCGEECPA